MSTLPGLELGRPSDPKEWLSADEARALERFVAWSDAPGFRLAVVSFAEIDKLRGVARWIASEAPSALLVDAAGLTPKEVMLRLRAANRGEGSLVGPLVLHGSEACVGTKQLFRGLNVARDDLAQHLPISWIIVLHAALRVDFEMLAPDLASYAGLWVGDSGPTSVAQIFPSREIEASIAWEVNDGQDLGSPSDLLNRAYAEINEGSLDRASDYLGQFDLTAATDVPPAFRAFVVAAHRACGGMVEEARRSLEQIVTDEQTDDPVLLGRCHNLLGGTYIALGNLRKARWNHERAAGMLEGALRAEPPRTDARVPLQIAEERLAAIREALGQPWPPATPFLSAPAAAPKTELPPPKAPSVSDKAPARKEASRASKEHLEMQSEPTLAARKRRSASQQSLDRTLSEGDPEERRTLLTERLEFAKRLAEADPSRADFQRDLSVSYLKLGDVQASQGNLQEALSLLTQGVEIAQRLAEAEPSRADFQRDLGVAYEKLGDVEVSLGNTQEARELFTKSLQIAKRLAEAEPNRADFQRDLAGCFERMATLDPDTAHWLDDAIAIRRRVLASTTVHPVLERELATALFQRGQQRASEDDLRESFAVLQSLHARGALDARYAPLLQRLEALFGGS